MRTYYTTAASTWGTQSYESYTGSDLTQYTTSGSSSTSNYYASGGLTSKTSFAETSNSSANHSLTLAQSSYSSTNSRYEEYSSSDSTIYYGSLGGVPTATYFEHYAYRSTLSIVTNSSIFQLTSRNLTGETYSTSSVHYYTSQAIEINLATNTYSNIYGFSYSNVVNTSTDATFSTADTSTSSYSSNVATIAYFPVGSYQVTLNGYTTSQTNTTTSLSSTQTYGVSTGTPYTSTSLVGYTDNTSSTTSFSTYTSSSASATITVTMNPRAKYEVVYERGTGERLFAITSQFQNTTKLLSEALSEFGTYTESAMTVLTDTASGTFAGLTSSSTTGSSSFGSVYLQFTQTRATYSVDEPYANSNPWFGGYQQGTTSVTFGGGPYDWTFSQGNGSTEATQRFTGSASISTTYNNSVIRINPLSYLSFSDTTTDYQNLVLTYNTTSLATP